MIIISYNNVCKGLSHRRDERLALALLDRGEVADNGSINQRAALDHCKEMVEELYTAAPSARVVALV
jgi:hypothetical protein